MLHAVGPRQVLHRDGCRPARGRGRAGRAHASRRPPARRRRTVRRLVGRHVDADVRGRRNVVPSASICSMRRSRCRFSSLKSGMPYISRPPRRSARSNTTTSVAGAVELLRGGEARRAGADDGDRLPVAATRRLRRDPALVPAAGRRSHLDLLIVTGRALMPSTQEPSHGAGQTRPVNSGKLLVLCRRSQRLAATGRGRPGRSTPG